MSHFTLVHPSIRKIKEKKKKKNINNDLAVLPSHDSIQGFSGIEFGINLPASGSVWFLLCWQASYPSIYYFISFVIPDHQKFRVTNFTIFHCPP